MATQKEELIAKALELGIELTGDETMPVLGELIKAKTEANAKDAAMTPAEKAAAEAALLKTQQEDEAKLLEESQRVEKERLEAAEKKRKEREAAEGTKDQERMYSKAEVQELIKAEFAKLKAGTTDVDDPNNLDDEDPYKQKKVRLPRFQNKFIVAFENTNTDEYFPDVIVHAFDVWNDLQKKNEAWVKVRFEDGSNLNIQLYTVLTRSQKVWVDLVERLDKDTSFSQGKVELAEVKDYSRAGTGVYKKLKVTQAEHSYKLRLPEVFGLVDGKAKEIVVGREVINW